MQNAHIYKKFQKIKNTMKLKDFLKNINTLVKNNPNVLELDVVYSKDDEGNEFNKISYTPTLGVFDWEEREFSDEDIWLEDLNSICIN